ncbi:beta strand repeat-containing protein [Ralstonia sp. UBA689]|uniref:beta strand repeat-containing protein n=1 Tax=Ralstonia sp. UBA689 TaxID=1947373 RepID=UPI0025E1F93C|nr:hypothetical protein [Ralstonia sp. UBA689]
MDFLFLGSADVFAAAPPASTIIGNQATAAYLDPNGLAQTATSNIVQTTVQQVGAFTLDGNAQVTSTVVNTKVGAAGSVVYAPHVLTNTGNGSDTFTISVAPSSTGFSSVAVYADANFDGLPDSTTALCSVTSNATCSVPAQTVAGSNGQFGFVVAYAIPSSVNGAAAPYASATVTAVPGTPALYTDPNKSAADVDNVNTSTTAAFNVTKAVAQPQNGIAAPGGGAWPTASTTGKRSSSPSCPTVWSAGLASSPSCQYTVYTLAYSNTGGASGRFNLQDAIGRGATVGMTYVAGSAVWSNASGTAMGDGPGGDPSGVDFQVTGGVMTFVDNDVPVSATRSVSFVVLINNTSSVGTTATNNIATFNPLDAKGATAAAPVGVTNSTTNGAPFTVQGTYSIALGAAASTANTAKDSVVGAPNAGSADTTTVTNGSAGMSVSFTQVVYNRGNATDTVNINSANPGSAGGNAFPTGTTFSYYKADGATQLFDTNGDGLPDTGPIEAGNSVTIVVKATLPATVAAGSNLNYSLTVTGTSVGDSTQIDATHDVLTNVTGALVDLTHSAGGTATGPGSDSGTGPSTAPTVTNTIPAGQTTTFPLFVTNNDSVDNSYSIAASNTASFPGALPAGWVVKFVAGNVTAANCASAPATTSVAVSAGQQSEVTACISVPVTQAPLTAQSIYFQVKSNAPASSGALVLDTSFDAVTVTAAAATYAATLTPNNSGQLGSGGSVAYAHTLTNTGTGACTGPYTVSASLPAADVSAGWTTAIYLDTNFNGVLDGADTLVTGPVPGPLAAGATQAMLVKVFGPGGATAGATSTATVTVTFPNGAASCGAPSATDQSTVVAGQIRLNKTQALDASCNGTVGSQSANPIGGAKPGQCIVYQVTATNQGTGTLTNLSINDAFPAYTSLNTTQPSVKCTSSGITPAFSDAVFTSTATSVSCGGGNNSVSPGAEATMTFELKINQ